MPSDELRYRIVLRPDANRVYAAAAPALAKAELDLWASASGLDDLTIEDAKLGSAAALDVTLRIELDDHMLAEIAGLSSTMAITKVGDDGAMTDLGWNRKRRFDDDLVSIQRYRGKTNEQFTALMVSVARSLSTAAAERAAQGLPVRLLDPVSGRGTTLNAGLQRGFTVAGVDHSKSDHQHFVTFMTQYLQDHREKYKDSKESPNKGPKAGTKSHIFTLRSGETVTAICGETQRMADLFAAKSFDMLVADMPYGVQHGSTSKGGLARGALDLVTESAAGWRQVLRSGASAVLAINTKTTPTSAVTDVLVDNGFRIVDDHRSFAHSVDRSIDRDLITALAI